MTDAYSARENLSSLPTMDGSRTALYLPIADTRPQVSRFVEPHRTTTTCWNTNHQEHNRDAVPRIHPCCVTLQFLTFLWELATDGTL